MSDDGNGVKKGEGESVHLNIKVKSADGNEVSGCITHTPACVASTVRAHCQSSSSADCNASLFLLASSDLRHVDSLPLLAYRWPHPTCSSFRVAFPRGE
jgi:hypothetical protein